MLIPPKMYNKNIWSFKANLPGVFLFQLTVEFSFQIIIKTCMTNLTFYHLFIKYNELNNQAEFS